MYSSRRQINVEIIKFFVKQFTIKKKFLCYVWSDEASRISYADEKDLNKYPDTVGRPIPGGKIIIKKKEKILEKYVTEEIIF